MLSTSLSEEVESLNNRKRELEEALASLEEKFVSSRDFFDEKRNHLQSEISDLKSANADAASNFLEAERQFKVLPTIHNSTNSTKYQEYKIIIPIVQYSVKNFRGRNFRPILAKFFLI